MCILMVLCIPERIGEEALTMYEELIEKLHCCVEQIRCGDCRYVKDCDGDRMMMSEAADAIEELSNAGSIYGKAWTLGYDAGRDENKPRWIPVTERLPEICERDVNGNITFSGRVWSCTDFGNGFYWQQIDQYTTNCGGGWMSEVPEDGFTPKVVAWMPLPEPPKEET